jgi:hypothetical protein
MKEKKRKEEEIEVEKIRKNILEEEKEKIDLKIDSSLERGTSMGMVQRLTLLNSPFNLGTPLNTMPTTFSYSSSQMLEIDDVGVSLGDYLFSK